MIRIEIEPFPDMKVLKAAEEAAAKVDFLTSLEEKIAYASVIYNAIQWGKQVK